LATYNRLFGDDSIVSDDTISSIDDYMIQKYTEVTEADDIAAFFHWGCMSA